jgi:hypothetical protein
MTSGSPCIVLGTAEKPKRIRLGIDQFRCTLRGFSVCGFLSVRQHFKSVLEIKTTPCHHCRKLVNPVIVYIRGFGFKVRIEFLGAGFAIRTVVCVVFFFGAWSCVEVTPNCASADEFIPASGGPLAHSGLSPRTQFRY